MSAPSPDVATAVKGVVNVSPPRRSPPHGTVVGGVQRVGPGVLGLVTRVLNRRRAIMPEAGGDADDRHARQSAAELVVGVLAVGRVEVLVEPADERQRGGVDPEGGEPVEGGDRVPDRYGTGKPGEVGGREDNVIIDERPPGARGVASWRDSTTPPRRGWTASGPRTPMAPDRPQPHCRSPELIDRDINGVEHPSDEIGPQNWDGEDRIMGRRAA